MNRNKLMNKLIGERTKLANCVSHWGLPKEELFPLDTSDLVKVATKAFEKQAGNMSPSQKLVCSRAICSRAEELEVRGIESSLAYKYASADLSPHFKSFIELRKQASAHMADDELNNLISIANVFQAVDDVNDRVEGLDKIASVLEDFDRRHELVGHWGSFFPDPSYTTFGLTSDPGESVEVVVKVAGFNVREQDFENVDWSCVEGKLPSEVIEGMKSSDDTLAVFSSLPDPEKEIVYQNLFMS